MPTCKSLWWLWIIIAIVVIIIVAAVMYYRNMLPFKSCGSIDLMQQKNKKHIQNSDYNDNDGNGGLQLVHDVNKIDESQDDSYIVFLKMTGCGWCGKALKELENATNVHPDMAKIKIYVGDIKIPYFKNIFNELGLRGAPAFVVVKNGEKTMILNGYAPYQKIQEVSLAVLNKK